MAKVPVIARVVAGIAVGVPATLLTAGVCVVGHLSQELVALCGGAAGAIVALWFQRFLTPESDT